MAFARFLFVRELRSADHALVKAKVEACRAAYARGGVHALDIYFSAETPLEQETSFVEVLGTGHDYFHFPQTQAERPTLLSLASSTSADTKESWIKLPSTERDMVWTISRSKLPAGSVMFVGCMTESHLRQAD